MPPPYTSVPEYVWGDFRDCALPFAPITRNRKDPPVPEVLHLDGENALKAAKRAAKEKPGRYYGAFRGEDGKAGFNIYEGSKVVMRYVVGG